MIVKRRPVADHPLPRYPIFVPSKGRPTGCLTGRFLTKDGTPFRLVIEAEEEAAYRAAFPDAEIHVLPFSNVGSVIPARNWIKQRSIDEGFDRHWQLDDNIWDIRRLYRGRRIKINSSAGLRIVEDFTDRYMNIAIAGMNYQMFVTDTTTIPFYLNCHVYSCCLFDNRLPFWWRGRYNEDTDICLQALSAGYCTIATNVVMAHKRTTMTQGGGNTETLSYRDDGRLRMARALERQWPYVVGTTRRFKRPQHVIRGSWKAFDTPLIRRDDVDFDALPETDEYGLRLVQVAEEIRSPVIAELLTDWQARNP